MTNATHPIGVVGAGTMGAGIAQAAASAGWTVYIFDIEKSVIDQTISNINDRFDRLVQKNRVTKVDAQATVSRIIPAKSLGDLASCDLIIEATSENLDLKANVLQQIGDIAKDAVLATNTSSLSVSKIGEKTTYSDRIVGLHFFNPAPIMQLVEAIQGNYASDSAISRATLLVECWGKTVVRASDTPGFIVNRIARPYYLESWRLIEDKLATVDEIDSTMQSLGEFKMGPFELMDMFGHDLNIATSQNIWERLGKPNRLSPSQLQETLVAKGNLGTKTGCGAYAHDDQNNMTPAFLVDRENLEIHDQLKVNICDFCLEACSVGGNLLQQYVFARVLVSVINEAMWAVSDGVATKQDIDTAMKLGTNYPRGPFEWSKIIGDDLIRELLGSLNETVSDNRFSAPPRPVTI